MRLDDLTVFVLKQIGAISVQHARPACAQGRRMLAARYPQSTRLHADKLHRLVGNIGIEDAHRVRAPADAGDHRVRLAAAQFRHLGQALATDNRLEVAHHHGVRVRTSDGPDDVEGVVDVGDPVAHRFVQRVLQRFRARSDRHHRRPEKLHAIDVLHLALDVLGAHVHHAFHAVARRHRRGRHTVHSGAGFGDHARFAHAPREKRLADGVVDLVSAGMVEILALDVDLGSAEHLRPALGVINGARATDVVLELVLEFGDEFRILPASLVGAFELVKRVHQRLGDEHAAIPAEMPLLVRKVNPLHALPLR